MSAFEDDEDKHAFPLLRKAIEDVERQRGKTIEGHRPVGSIYDEIVDFESSVQKYGHAYEIAAALTKLVGKDDVKVLDPNINENPTIHIVMNGRAYVLGMDDAT